MPYLLPCPSCLGRFLLQFIPSVVSLTLPVRVCAVLTMTCLCFLVCMYCLGFYRFAWSGLVAVVPCFALLRLRPLSSLLLPLLWSYRVIILSQIVLSGRVVVVYCLALLCICLCIVFVFVVNTDRQTITTLYLCILCCVFLCCFVLSCRCCCCLVLSCRVVLYLALPCLILSCGRER